MHRLNRVSFHWGPEGVWILCRVPMNERPQVEEMIRNGKYELCLQKVKKKRSLNANAYMWKLCDEIAKAIGTTKEDVYRRAIGDVGVFDTITLPPPAYVRFKDIWQSRGVGWMVEMADKQNSENVTVFAYYGSSTYNSQEMARLIDWLVDAAQELGIDTMTPRERSLLIEKWKPEV